MAIKELFYDNRPRVLLDPRASQRIDPRFTFTRDSIGTFVDRNGIIQTAGVNEPRFNYDPKTGEFLGLLLEESRRNLFKNSSVPCNDGRAVTDVVNGIDLYTITSDNFTSAYLSASGAGNSAFITVQQGVEYVVSFTLKGSIFNTVTCRLITNIGGLLTDTGSVVPTSAGGRVSVKLTCTVSGSAQLFLGMLPGRSVNFGGLQVEAGSYPTSYIPTTTIAVTRAADLLSIEAPLPATGSIYIDARAISANENDTLLSLKNDSNNKIDLAYLSNTATYNSLALIANYDGVIKSSLPLPVPTTDRERNIITYGANNYQYGRDSSRFATSLSSSVPTNLNKLSIGHDAVDATKAFHGYINTVYAWSGELTREVAEALVRGEIDAINADTYSPTGPAGSLALVIKIGRAHV